MYERRGRTEATVVLLAWSWPAFRRAWPRTGRAKALVFDSALGLAKPGLPRTQLAECSRAEASWAGVYARRFDKIGKKMR